MADQPLEVRIYGTAAGAFDLYDYDGQTYDFEKGKYTVKRLTTARGMEDVVSGGGWTYGPVSWRRMGTLKR